MSIESTRTFDDLCQSFVSTSLVGEPTDFFGIPAREEQHFFVSPLLREKDDTTDPHVTLISARGAAGKSTAAVELAARLGAPLWRLERDKAVSATSLEFVLGQYLGSHDVKSRLDGISRPLVVIDSLDEARARVSAVSWNEFIESLSHLAQYGLHYILLGRERTLEDVWVALSDLGNSVAWWEISHFALPQCGEYVDGVVSGRDPQTDCSAKEYVSARDALISSLWSAAEGTHADAFVGYPPVLDAVAAALINRPNLLAIRQRFEDPVNQIKGRIGLLERILNDLLERDQTKVAPLAEELGIDPALVYGPSEQIGWLCHSLEGADPPDLSYIPSSAKRQEYVKRALVFAGDHPFRSESAWASPVFEAYVAAVKFDSSAFSPDRLIAIGNKSGLLFDFVDSSDSLLLTEAQFAALHSSIIASEWANAMASISLNSVSGSDFEGTFVIKRSDESARATSFDLISGEPGVLRVLGPLTELSIRSSRTIVVAGRRQGTVLGPDLFISADHVRFEGHSLEFARRLDSSESSAEGEPSVIIEARESIKLPETLSQLPTDGDFELRVPSTLRLTYPWFEYKAELVEDEAPNEKVIRLLNKLMSLTRSHGHKGDRGVFIKKLEGRQPLPPGEFGTAIGELESANVVRVENEMVFLREEWEAHRYSGKTLKGQRQLSDVMDAWAPVIKRIEDSLWGRR